MVVRFRERMDPGPGKGMSMRKVIKTRRSQQLRRACDHSAALIEKPDPNMSIDFLVVSLSALNIVWYAASQCLVWVRFRGERQNPCSKITR